MINLIGNQIRPYRENFKLNENEFFFDYQKKEVKDKRKNGPHNNFNINAKIYRGKF